MLELLQFHWTFVLYFLFYFEIASSCSIFLCCSPSSVIVCPAWISFTCLFLVLTSLFTWVLPCVPGLTSCASFPVALCILPDWFVLHALVLDYRWIILCFFPLFGFVCLCWTLHGFSSHLPSDLWVYFFFFSQISEFNLFCFQHLHLVPTPVSHILWQKQHDTTIKANVLKR